MSKISFTIIAEKGPDGFYVGHILEHPAAISQGRTMEELKKNLIDALRELILAQRDLLIKKQSSKKSITRKLSLNYEA